MRNEAEGQGHEIGVGEVEGRDLPAIAGVLVPEITVLVARDLGIGIVGRIAIRIPIVADPDDGSRTPKIQFLPDAILLHPQKPWEQKKGWKNGHRKKGNTWRCLVRRTPGLWSMCSMIV